MLNKPKEKIKALSSPLWFNSHITTPPIFIREWYNKGIETIGDIMDDHGNLLTQETFQDKYGIITNFITYLRITTLA